MNQNLSEYFEEHPVQISGMSTPDGEFAWLSDGENATYILDEELESYESDLVIYRPKESKGKISRVAGVHKAEGLAYIPQTEPLNGLIKGLEDR